jgi:putative ATP-dependent endonuclease of OLD family
MILRDRTKQADAFSPASLVRSVGLRRETSAPSLTFFVTMKSLFLFALHHSEINSSSGILIIDNRCQEQRNRQDCSRPPMQIRQVKVERFRGIKKLDWRVDGQLICLIGPGDSTKSTILSAIEYALSPRWKIDFNDSDFYNGVPDEPFLITVTVGDLPEELKSDSKLGTELRGWNKIDGLHDEPSEDDEHVVSIELRVDKSLEPRWSVVNDRKPEGRPLSATDREALGLVRIGEFIDYHLTWTRGSALSRLTQKTSEMASLLAEISRAARDVISPVRLPALSLITKELASLSKPFGVQPKSSFQPHLDTKNVGFNTGAFSLHDGDVPIRLSGLGTRRLIALVLQKKMVSDGAVALIDEVEEGLEPHRLRRLLRALRAQFETTQPGATAQGQLFMTTHSSVVTDELSCKDLRIVRADSGVIQVRKIEEDIQKRVRHSPEALLGSAIIVCEGETEIGFCKALDDWWSSDGQYDPLATKGIILVDGEGFESERRAKAFASAGYPTALFGDSDRVLNPSEPELKNAGIKVITWADELCLEQRIALDLPWTGVQYLLEIASDLEGEDKVRGAVCNRCQEIKQETAPLSAALKLWPESTDLRKAIGLAANGGEWFKNADSGEELGRIVVKQLPAIPTTDLAIKIAAFRTWIDTCG